MSNSGAKRLKRVQTSAGIVASSSPCWVFFFYHGATAPVGQGLFIIEVSWSYADTSHSVGLLWASDHSYTETFTWQHTTLTTQTSMLRVGFEPRSPRKRAAANLHIRPCGHWDRPLVSLEHISFCVRSNAQSGILGVMDKYPSVILFVCTHISTYITTQTFRVLY
jgi:hypothetical protein